MIQVLLFDCDHPGAYERRHGPFDRQAGPLYEGLSFDEFYRALRQHARLNTGMAHTHVWHVHAPTVMYIL